MSDTVVFYPKKNGHFKNYAETLEKLCGTAEFAQGRISIDKLLCQNKLVVVHGDGVHLLVSILATFRSALRKKTYFFSVRTNELFDRDVSSFIKRQLVRLVSWQRNSYFISIHKGNTPLENAAVKCGLEIIFIYDLQMWDLRFGGVKREECPHELDTKFREGSKPVLLIPGSIDKKRCVSELMDSLDYLVDRFRVIIAGLVPEDVMLSAKCDRNESSLLLIDRYLTDGELYHLYRLSDYVYAYYDLSVERPSGVFGRALQMNRYVFVRTEGFLERLYGQHSLVLPVKNIYEMKPVASRDGSRLRVNVEYNSSDVLKKLLGS